MLLWTDVETSGLDPRNELLLELGVIVTQDDLSIVGEKSWVVGYSDHAICACREGAEEVVRQMHDASGLWRDSIESLVSLEDVQAHACAFILETGAKGSPMAGNSITLDRNFLAEKMPELFKLYSYRSLDVSALTEIAKRWYPVVYQAYEDRKKSIVRPHRALDDLRASIELLKFYRETVLR